MRIIFFFVFSTFFYVSLFSQSEYRNTMIEECLSLHLKYFFKNDRTTSDTIFICSNSRHAIKKWEGDLPSLVNRHPIVLLAPKEIGKRVQDAPLYPVYFVTLKKNKSTHILYIATMSVKWSNRKLCFGNTEENSNYLIENNHIKRIAINGETKYQE